MGTTALGADIQITKPTVFLEAIYYSINSKSNINHISWWLPIIISIKRLIKLTHTCFFGYWYSYLLRNVCWRRFLKAFVFSCWSIVCVVMDQKYGISSPLSIREVRIRGITIISLVIPLKPILRNGFYSRNNSVPFIIHSAGVVGADSTEKSRK